MSTENWAFWFLNAFCKPGPFTLTLDASECMVRCIDCKWEDEADFSVVSNTIFECSLLFSICPALCRDVPAEFFYSIKTFTFIDIFWNKKFTGDSALEWTASDVCADKFYCNQIRKLMYISKFGSFWEEETNWFPDFWYRERRMNGEIEGIMQKEWEKRKKKTLYYFQNFINWL